MQITISTVSVFELYAGLNLSTKRIEEMNKIDNVLGNIVVNHTDFDSAREAGEILTDKKHKGLTTDPEDAVMAEFAELVIDLF